MAVLLDKAIFVHVPKTGGNSIAAALGGTTRSTVMHLPRKALPFDGRPSFGFIRDPWHRMVSLYYFLWQSPAKHLPRVDPDEIRRMGFKRWLLEGGNWMSNEPQPDGRVYTRWSGKYSAAATYPGLRVVAAETDLPPQQRRPVTWYLEGCTHIGKVETMQADFDRICRDVGLAPKHLGHANRTHHKPHDWRAEYDSETIEHVAHYFAPDIAVGGYFWER